MDAPTDTAGYGRPDAQLGSYALITAVFLALVIGLFWIAGSLGIGLSRIGMGDMILLGLATHKIAWLLSFDVVLSFLRAPFTRFRGWMSPGAVLHEQARGSGLRYAIGELLACPWCLGMWIAALFVFAFIFWPDITRTVAVIFVVLMMADVLQVLYLLLGKLNTRATRWSEH